MSETIVHNVVCSFCGCLCDDLIVMTENGEIVGTENACRISHQKFMGSQQHRILKPLIRKNGTQVEVSMEEAISRAAEILRQAKRPLIYGWGNATVEAIKEGVHISEIAGGIMENCTSVCHGPSVLAIQNVGASSCTLGEIRNRSDLIIYWGANPIHAHPRHLSRYSLFPRGYFRERGRRERKFVVADTRYTSTAEIADLFIQVEPGYDYEILGTLRAFLHGTFKPEQSKIGGVPKEQLLQLVQMMKKSRFVTLFFGLGLTQSSGKHRNIDNAISLITDLSKYTKAVLMPMRGHSNVAGINRVSSWQTTFPYAIDFARGYPRYFPGETTSVDLLTNREVDAAIIVASDPVSHFPWVAGGYLGKIPTISVSPHWTPTTELAEVVIPSQMSGIEVIGTFYRMDNIPMHLRKVIDPPEGVLADEDILKMIKEKI
ncbi:MAG: formylmethanofuran dehydrogenase subunit B [Candidatus Hodarchaeota archaeon]